VKCRYAIGNTVLIVFRMMIVLLYA